MSAMLLPQFIDGIMFGVIFSAAMLILYPITLFTSMRKDKAKLESSKDDKVFNKAKFECSINALNKYLKIHLPIFVLISIAWFTSILWYYYNLHAYLFSPSYSIQNNLQQSLNALTFADDIGGVLDIFTAIFIIFDFLLYARDGIRIIKEFRNFKSA